MLLVTGQLVLFFMVALHFFFSETLNQSIEKELYPALMKRLIYMIYSLMKCIIQVF
jgi:hypothetical protein